MALQFVAAHEVKLFKALIARKARLFTHADCEDHLKGQTPECIHRGQRNAADGRITVCGFRNFVFERSPKYRKRHRDGFRHGCKRNFLHPQIVSQTHKRNLVGVLCKERFNKAMSPKREIGGQRLIAQLLHFFKGRVELFIQKTKFQEKRLVFRKGIEAIGAMLHGQNVARTSIGSFIQDVAPA